MHGNSIKFEHIVLPLTTIGKSLYTLAGLTFYPKGVLTIIGSCQTSGIISKVEHVEESQRKV